MGIVVKDIAWAAGFIEGEGCLATCGYAPRISVSQVEIAPLQKLERLFGGRIIAKKLYGLSKKPLHVWNLTNINAIGVMMMIYDFMSPKRQREIQKTVGLWKDRGARVGDRHYSAVASDTDVLVIVQRVLSGESMSSVAKELGISHATISMWMRGKNRRNIRKNIAPLIQGNHWKPRRHSASIPKDEALFLLRRLCAGERIADISRETGLHHSIFHGWITGRTRPYLRATLEQEGVFYYKRHLNDEEALAVLRHVRSGEPIASVAKEVGISEGTIHFWLHGETRPHLLAALNHEGA